ncbi:MAG: hypothetical protein A2X54_08890 [Nitrospirae bacterium GWF2_44_13]|nr:MAG: hypothetical protein A2X54_08890 [Nitrospirae bacterium GWF2_44_13]OGW65770.1 MAG: hypothetical protein A2222_05490 [Nitrospirae bacterium RIFOXYA2_FULL_44_9]HBG92741.1 hypothetical protein [Nitrospiraceae bacterium]
MERIPYGKYTEEVRQEATEDITEYIEIFYNRQGKQKRWGIYSQKSSMKRELRHEPIVSTIDSRPRELQGALF